MKHRLQIAGLAALAALAVLVCAPTAFAGDYGRDPLMVRGGVTHWNNLNQFHFGVQTDFGELRPSIALLPSVELGFGDSLTFLTIHGDLVYRFTEVTTPPWGLYGGGGLSLNFMDADHGGSDTDLGLSAMAGFTREFANGHRGLFELRFGLIDYPDLKITFGYSVF
ncbi:MAG: hypothetical protein AB7V45_14745 [Candidatus Krumholzibacteriia bacterium]